MPESIFPEMPLVNSVLHPTDFSEDGENAFAHALAIALMRQTRLALLHAGKRELTEDSWTKFPGVRATLERWGLLEKGSPRSAVFDEFRVRVKKIFTKSRNPVDAVVDYLDENPVDLIVVSTEGREGLPRFFEGSVAEKVARRSQTMTLFVPEGVPGFVAIGDGTLSLDRVLIPVSHKPDPRAAFQFAIRASQLMGSKKTEITLLHVGTAESAPVFDLPQDPGWSWRPIQREGELEEVIVSVAEEIDANVIAMVTQGREGVRDALRGTTTEQVVRRAPCPVLSIPQAWVDSVAADEGA